MAYATRTTVSVDKTKAQIEKLVEQYEAEQFYSGWAGANAVVGFRMCDRIVKFILPLPDKKTETAARYEKICKVRWRALRLVLKAKLEAVEIGISDLRRNFWAMCSSETGKRWRKPLSPRSKKPTKRAGCWPFHRG